MATPQQRLIASGGAALALVIVAVTGCTTGGSGTAPTASAAAPLASAVVTNSPAPSSPSPAPIPTAVTGTVWVADEYGNSITVIDAATNERVTTLTGSRGRTTSRWRLMGRRSGRSVATDRWP